MKIIPYAKQQIDHNDIEAVVNVLSSEYLTQGPTVELFESCVSAYCNVRYAFATNSATSALHLACMALELARGDLVWTTPNTFVATANCALYCGASVDFVDIDPHSYNMSISALSEKLIEAKKTNKLPKIVIPVHFAGYPSEMREIKKLSELYGFKIIEDASHAIGAEYSGTKVGSCNFSDITIFSFHPVKIITCGEGGMAMTNSLSIAKKLKLYRSHGITSDISEMESRPKEEIWNYQQILLGMNYRMTDILAALGLSQLKKLDEFVSQRSKIAEIYSTSLQDLPLHLPLLNSEAKSSWHLYVVRLKLDKINKGQKDVYRKLRKDGVMVNLHYIPVYRQPFYENMGFQEGYCPEAEKYFRECLSLPMYFGLTNEDQQFVVKTLNDTIC